jgi:hypothetical protein
MVSRKNTVILLFATAGLTVAYGGHVLTDVDDTIHSE